MRLLFVKPELVWPRSSGHDVYCYYMMKALAEEGAEVSLLTAAATDRRAVEPIPLAFCGQLSEEPTPARARLTRLQERFRSFWGVSHAQIESVRRTAVDTRADVVIAFGLPALPYLAGVDTALRVWAMADEWVYHHLTQVRLTQTDSWNHVKSALIKGLYERAYRRLVDRVWVVSETDRRAARWFAGMRVADLLPNGVDADYYRPVQQTEIPASAVFWGRLDFEPNIDALTWFCRRVWPDVTRQVPHARFTIIGFQPTAEVEGLTAIPGVFLRPNVPDLRPAVCQHAVVALPMVSGGGIKNKLLEGAALGRTIVCTPRACMDLRPAGSLPLVQAGSPGDWVRQLVRLWSDDATRTELGRQARKWVSDYYSWSIPARDALDAFRQSRSRRGHQNLRHALQAPIPRHRDDVSP